MFRHHFQHLELLLKRVKSAHFNGISFYIIFKSVKYLFVFKNISES